MGTPPSSPVTVSTTSPVNLLLLGLTSIFHAVERPDGIFGPLAFPGSATTLTMYPADPSGKNLRVSLSLSPLNQGQALMFPSDHRIVSWRK